MERLRTRNEWKFASVLLRADRGLAWTWWTLLILRGLLPALFALAMGALVGAVERHEPLTPQLAIVGVVFVLLQVLAPIHQAIGANLGSRTVGLALRPAHRRLRPAARHGPPRESRSSRATSRWRATSTSASPARRCRSRWTSSPAGWSR